MFNYKYLCQEG